MLIRFTGLMALAAIAGPWSRAESPPSAIPEAMAASDVLWSLQKLQTLGRALYVAAHPDDENTNVISHLSLGAQYDTAYLSLTRGDGGQNLIGPELGDLLGVIRTQELIEARRVDGGQQFFSRAKDFGYSKTAEETLRVWDKEQVLADTVLTLRRFRPDVIITRFAPEPGFTHGHHTASTLLALEAFEAAADPSRFSEQLEFVEPWQAKRVVWNASNWFFRNSGREFNEADYLSLEVGGYDPILGKSYNEIAAASRSMHSSQGFGTRVDRGSRIEYFSLLAGEPMETSLFDGVDTAWSRLDGSAALGSLTAQMVKEFDPSDPSATVPDLLRVRRLLADLPDRYWAEIKAREVDALVAACLGLNIQALADRPWAVGGESLPLSIEAVNRSRVSARLLSIELPFDRGEWSLSRDLPYNARIEAGRAVDLPKTLPLSQPFWLERESDAGMFAVTDAQLAIMPEREDPFSVVARVEVEGEKLAYRIPIEFRQVDPALGEIRRRVGAIPAASVAFSDPVIVFPNFEPRSVRVAVTAARQLSGALSLRAPEGWTVEPASIPFDDMQRDETRVAEFRVQPARPGGAYSLDAVFESGGQRFERGLTRLSYGHIREQAVMPPAATRAVAIDLARDGQRIGYIDGAGDRVAEGIEQMGYEVVRLDPRRIDSTALQGLDAIALGVRAYNVAEGIDRAMPILFDYVRDGGVVIVQYNTNGRMLTDQLAPYGISISRDRVTDEAAPVRFLAPEHPALSRPNRIGPADFEGWSQERGLYFLDSWDPAFTPLISTNDPGEPPRDGALLVARHGSGYFVYTGLSWFRQLPAGVPGAYRLMANLLSLGHNADD